jgi:hypothetical protein
MNTVGLDDEADVDSGINPADVLAWLVGHFLIGQHSKGSDPRNRLALAFDHDIRGPRRVTQEAQDEAGLRCLPAKKKCVSASLESL